ncbi:MAG: phage portal protein [Caulobacteraceae bacterium]|nr:phage portal protein [Caulobacteraceae bacterium]
MANIVNVNLKDYTPVSATERPDRGGWISYGVDNLFPQYLADLAETSPIHGALCISIGDMIAGKGVSAGAYQNRADELNLNAVSYDLAHDYKKYGGFYMEVIYSVDRSRVAQIKHLPFTECRLAVSGEDELITGIFHSNDWTATKKKKNKPTFLPVFNSLKKTEEAKQVYYCFRHTSGFIYPKPDYWSAVNYIELSKQIGIFHVNGISNGMFPSAIVSFFNGQQDPETQKDIIRDWEGKLSGSRNAGKFIMSFNEPGTTAPSITPLTVNDADKLYEYLTTTSRTEVMIAHRVTTPLLFGIRGEGSGFGSNKDEMATGLEIFTNQVIEPAQRQISRSLETVLDWELPGINIFITPNTPLGVKAEVSSGGTAEAVSTQAMNGAQIASMIEICMNVATGTLPVESGKAIMAASFPSLTSLQIDDIFKNILPGSVNPQAAALEAIQTLGLSLSGKKKEVTLAESYEPTKEMAAEAELGLKWREEYGRGGTEIGVARARDISNGRNLSLDTVKRMVNYFSRHEIDKEAEGWNQGENNFPSAGRIAWQLWGGDPGKAWAERIVNNLELKKSPEYLPDSVAHDLIDLGHDQPKDWYLLDSYEVDLETDDLENEALDTISDVNLAEVGTGSARPNAKSEQDKQIEGRKFYVRYKYEGENYPNSRPFCKAMLAADKLYRKEDIINMKNYPVNPGWGPYGRDKYSVWEFKGGGNCRHYFKKLLFISAKGFGLDLKSPFIKERAWAEAEKAGLKINNNWRVGRKPVTMPYRGFLEDNPIWGKNGSAYKK